MAELEMQNYEEFRQKEDVTYDNIKIGKEKIETNKFVITSRNQWLKHILLILTISVFAAGVSSTVTYFTVCAQLKQFTVDLIEMKLMDIESKNEIKLQEMENRYNLTYSRLQKQINDSTDLAQLKQFTLDLIEMKLTDIESKNEIKLQEMENRYNLTSSSLQEQINDSTEMVGFTAFGGSSVTGSSGYQLKFPVIKSSIGISNLSSMRNNGTFICEKKGLYLLIVTVMICSSGDSAFNIYKNNHQYMHTYIGRSDLIKIDCHSGTGTAVVELHVNDALNVRNAYGRVELYETYSSFSAIKLK